MAVLMPCSTSTKTPSPHSLSAISTRLTTWPVLSTRSSSSCKGRFSSLSVMPPTPELIGLGIQLKLAKQKQRCACRKRHIILLLDSSRTTSGSSKRVQMGRSSSFGTANLKQRQRFIRPAFVGPERKVVTRCTAAYVVRTTREQQKSAPVLPLDQLEDHQSGRLLGRLMMQ